MVDEIQKFTSELFTLGGVEQIKRVRPKPEDHNEQGSDAEDEGLQAHLDRLADVGAERKRKGKGGARSESKAKSKGVVSKSVGDEGEVDDDVKHVDLII